jgi:diguanylate cyclase (GGDEF)-like protein
MPRTDDPSEPALRVLLAEDAESDARLLEDMLRRATLARYSVRRVGTLRQAIEACAEEVFDVLLVDLGLPDSFGIDTLQALVTQIGPVPIVVLTGHDDTATAVAAVRHGAQDYLVKGSLQPRQVELSLLYAVERSRVQRSLIDLAHLDDLTGLPNRRGFVLEAERRLELARRNGGGGVLFYFDLDGLKAINDTVGHPVGDEVLRDAAAVLRGAFRSRDLLGRLGGDELAALADGLPAGDLRVVEARLAGKIAERNHLRADGQPELVLSAGSVCYGAPSIPPLAELLRQADAAMYRQKTSGRRPHIVRAS